MSESMKIGIAGAGIMGRLLAWRLSTLGHDVTIFDKDALYVGSEREASAAAFTAAGMLTPYSEVESAELLIYQMGMRSLQLWPEWLKALNADSGYYQKGSLIVAHSADKSDLNRFEQQLKFKLAPSEQQFQHLAQAQLAELEPELASHFANALYLPEEAWLCTKCVMRNIVEQLMAKRVACYGSTEVESVTANTIRAKNKNFIFDWAIDCRGLGAKPQLSELRGVRGELIWLQAPDVNITRLVRLMHPRYRLYLVPKGRDDIYVIGATQIESDDAGPISVRSSLELLSAAYSLHPGFAEARIIDTKTNCRPALRDNLPRIEQSPGLLRINGLYRHGFLLAPTMVEEAIHCLTQSPATYSDIIRVA